MSWFPEYTIESAPAGSRRVDEPRSTDFIVKAAPGDVKLFLRRRRGRTTRFAAAGAGSYTDGGKLVDRFAASDERDQGWRRPRSTPRRSKKCGPTSRASPKTWSRSSTGPGARPVEPNSLRSKTSSCAANRPGSREKQRLSRFPTKRRLPWKVSTALHSSRTACCFGLRARLPRSCLARERRNSRSQSPLGSSPTSSGGTVLTGCFSGAAARS